MTPKFIWKEGDLEPGEGGRPPERPVNEDGDLDDLERELDEIYPDDWAGEDQE